MRNRRRLKIQTALSVIPLTAVLLARVASAQTGSRDQNEIRDPEVMKPALQQPGSPCVIDASAVRDPRINQEVLRVMQTTPRTRSTPKKVSRYVETKEDDTSKFNAGTSTKETKFRPIGCGFYFEDTTYNSRSYGLRYRSGFLKTGGSSSFVKTALQGPDGELFSETKWTHRFYDGRMKTETEWSQLTSLEVFGNKTPVAVGNRYGTRETTTEKSITGGRTYSMECEVIERRSASDFHPRLTGNAFIEKCKSSFFYPKDHTRNVSTAISVSFPDNDRIPSFDPNKCRLEWRSASEFVPQQSGDAFLTRCTSGETSSVSLPSLSFSFDPDACRVEVRAASDFNRSLRDRAYATRCSGSSSNSVYFPELDQYFWVDTIDGSFRSDPKDRNLLTDVVLAP